MCSLPLRKSYSVHEDTGELDYTFRNTAYYFHKAKYVCSALCVIFYLDA